MKKCIICSVPAAFSIKDSSDFYCQECAEENFDSVEYLQKIEGPYDGAPKIPLSPSDAGQADLI
ncbi:hypothetical protein HYU14_06475 [Candidatus Woesearchaeota archaeon]|nr:hypothetical protein [Candidatus Woesearchaeota archaeon]